MGLVFFLTFFKSVLTLGLGVRVNARERLRTMQRTDVRQLRVDIMPSTDV